MVTDEKFFAWLDGELDDSDSATVEAEVAADPMLARRAEEHRALQQRLAGAFGSLIDAPIPERIAKAAVSRDVQVIDFGAARRTGARRRPWLPLPQWAAIAATLIVGLVAGTMIPTGGNAPIEVRDGRMYAAASLDRALDAQLASAPTGDVRVGLTFRDRTGAICRSFTAEASSGLACRQDGGWQMRGLFVAPEGQGGDYRMAAGMDPNLAALIDSSIAGEPLDAAQEKAARQRGWR